MVSPKKSAIEAPHSMQDKIDEPYFVSVNNHNMEMGDIILPENFNIHI